MEVYDTHISPGKNSADHAGPQEETPGSVMRWRGEESGNWGSRNQRNADTLTAAVHVSNKLFLSMTQDSPVFCLNPRN